MQKHIKDGIKMAGKITRFFRETQFSFSIVVTIFGIILIMLGVAFFDFKYFASMLFNNIDEIKEWMLYVLIIGFVVLIAGIYYLYSFLKNRKFIMEEIKTNKRSELLKKHAELKVAVKHMPSKYQKMLETKEEELSIK